MIHRILHSKNLVACLLAEALGMVLYITMPFPEENLFFELMFLGARPVFVGFKFCYILLLYATPYIGYSVLLYGLYIFALKIPQRIQTSWLPVYPDPYKRGDLSVIFGEVQSPKTCPSRGPEKDRGLVLEVKGDFCHKIKGILAMHCERDDYIEIGLDSPYRYNPVHNDSNPSLGPWGMFAEPHALQAPPISRYSGLLKRP